LRIAPPSIRQRKEESSMNGVRRIASGLILLLATCVAPLAPAADYPAKPIKLISPYSPGGGNDLTARVIAEALTPRLGQPVLVENKAGAGGLIGSDYVLKSAPDGYTLLFASLDTLTMVPALKRDMPYRMPDDVTYIAKTSENGMTFAVNPKLPVKTIAEFVAYAKANPGVVRYGTNGVGAAPHLAVELFMKKAGIRMQHVPYKGISNAMTDLLGGHIDMVPLTPIALSSYLNSDALRVIGYTGAARHPMIPNVPTLAESGFPQATVTVWYSLVGPSNLPAPVAERLRKELTAALSDPAVRAKLESSGSTVSPVYGDAFRKMVVDEFAQWREIGREQNIVLE
jgi:tripartite-type tricarboxylate transporter receptor subunit TctC